MKFNVQGRELLNRLSAVSKVLGSKNALSIFDNFLLSVEGNTLTITGSDQETVLVSSLEIMDVEGEGKFCINAKRLIEMVKEVAAQPLSFEINESTYNIGVNYLNGYFEFMGLNGDDYPSINQTTDAQTRLQIPVSVIRSGLDYTLFAVSTDTIRPIMTGICIDITEDSVTFVSSDTHKLVRYINKIYSPGLEARVIMPAKTANILRSLLPKEDAGLIDISMDESGALFTLEGFSLATRFIKGNYPNYNRVIPSDNPFSLSVDRQTLLAAMKRVAIFASKASSLVSVAIEPDLIKLESHDLDLSIQAREEVACSYDNDPMTIGFNAQYLIEVLNNLPGDSIRIEFSLPSRPGLFIPEELGEEESLVTLQMPMQVIE